MTDTRPLQTLSSLLDDPRVRVVVRPERFAPSAIYDLDYRGTVTAMAFDRHAELDVVGRARIAAARLKLIQFVACRPWLVPVLQQWSDNRLDPQASLLSSQRLRRGFMADTMHDDVVGFLAARDVLRESATALYAGAHVDILKQWNAAAATLQLFERERRAIDELGAIRITSSMLEGW